jgi:hypothetical protein
MTDVPREDRSEDQAVDVPEEEPAVDTVGIDPAESVAAEVADEPAYDERPSSRAVEPTGHPAVDEVLRSLDQLDGRPVDEHVAVFEQAHERLRQALSGATDDDAAPPTAP